MFRLSCDQLRTGIDLKSPVDALTDICSLTTCEISLYINYFCVPPVKRSASVFYKVTRMLAEISTDRRCRVLGKVCTNVDIYGFATEEGYSKWTRYFSAPASGHHPLRGRAFYQVPQQLSQFWFPLASCPLETLGERRLSSTASTPCSSKLKWACQ